MHNEAKKEQELERGERTVGGFRRLCLVLVGALTLIGCDTVARISFQHATLNEVHTSGVTPLARTCGSPKDGLVARVVFTGTDGGVIRPGDSVGGQDFSLANTDVAVGGGSFEEARTENCSGISCASGFSCEKPSLSQSVRSCTAAATLTANNSPKFVSKLDKDQTFVVVLETSASVRAMYAGKTKDTIQYDYNNDGVIDAKDEQLLTEASVNYSVANANKLPKEQDELNAFVSRMLRPYADAARAAKDRDNVNTRFGLYLFGEKLTYSGATGKNKGGYASGLIEASAALSTANVSTLGEQELADPFGALERIVGPNPETASVPTLVKDAKNQETVLVLFVDGPDDVRRDPSEAIKRLKENNVRVFIVHTDPAVSDLDHVSVLYPDIPEYYANQSTACKSDADCYSFEACRVPMKITPGTVVSEKRCVVNRDKDRDQGRTGPVDAYARMACETGGGYIYLRDTLKVAKEQKIDLAWYPYALDGLWELPLYTGAAEKLKAKTSYRMSASLEVKGGDKTKSILLNNLGSKADTRSALVP